METQKPYDRRSEKVVTMPTFDAMSKKLEENGLLGQEPVIDDFMKKFANSVADSEKVGMGLNMAWELAKYDCFKEYPPIIAGLADMYYDRVIDAVTPDPEVATQAKDFHKMILEEVRKKS
ncbi:MAG: hypothetical protein AAB550_01200 [Patescibacteria group bacterium]